MVMRVYTAHVHENSLLNIGNLTLAHTPIEGVYARSEGK